VKHLVFDHRYCRLKGELGGDLSHAKFHPNPVVLAEGDPLAELCAWMRRNLDRDLTIESLAGRARMSRRTFIRRFEAATGMSPGEWVLQDLI
jgi:AraC family transcriptional activator FtrA